MWRLTPAVLHFKALVEGKIEEIIPAFPVACPTETAVSIRQTMP